LREFSTPVSKTLAEALYVGILVDTMAFRNANTNSDCLGLAARLVEAGADPAELWQKIFGQRPVGRLKLEGEFLSSLRTSLGGRLVWGVVDDQMLKRHRLEESAIEGFVERALDARGAEMAILFLEESPATTRISFRSREPVAVDGLARELGGGGHRLAAGAILDGAPSQVVPSVLQRAKAFLMSGIA
jgi:phosphoesterase RecJ-like protein